MNAKFASAYLIPLSLGLILLSGFIGYFLHSEYQKEKQAVLMEKRDDVFVELIGNIRAAGPVEWLRDTAGNEVIVRLDQKSKDSSSTSSDLDVSAGHLTKVVKQSQLITVDYRPDSVIAVFDVDGRKKNETDVSKLRILHREFEMPDSNVRFHFRTHEQGSQAGGGFELKLDADISKWEVWRRLYPQVFFSMILFFTVILAFAMMYRNLKKEKQLAELRNDFMSNMSHELKTPVSTVSVALEALSNFGAGESPTLRREYIEISKAELKRLGMLVDKALNISLFERGQASYDLHELDLKEVITAILKTLKVQFDNQQANVEFSHQGEEFKLIGDQVHLTNVIHNLIENGIKYSGTPAQIGIHLASENGRIILSVSDHGEGIDEKYHKHIFDKFFRVPKGNVHAVKGHGLGLSYVRQVVENHGGSISLSSKPGQGSTFVIHLPGKNYFSRK